MTRWPDDIHHHSSSFHARGVFRKLGATQQLELGSCGISDNKNNTYTPPATAPPSSYESPDYDNNSSSLEVFQTLKMTDKSNRHSSSRSKKKPPPPLEPIKVDSESDRFRDLAPPSPASCPSTPENANGVWVWPSRVDVSETARGDNGRKHSKKDGGVTEFVVVSAMDEGKRSNEDDVSRKPSITVNTSFASSCRCVLDLALIFCSVAPGFKGLLQRKSGCEVGTAHTGSSGGNT